MGRSSQRVSSCGMSYSVSPELGSQMCTIVFEFPHAHQVGEPILHACLTSTRFAELLARPSFGFIIAL